MSMNAFFKLIEDGNKYYKNTLKAKSEKNKIAHAEKAVKYFNKAIETGKSLDNKKIRSKVPEIHEFTTQLHTIIAISNMSLGKLDNAVKAFSDAIKSNSKSPPSAKQKERSAFLNLELAKIAAQTGNLKNASSFGRLADNEGKKLEPKDRIDLLNGLTDVFTKALDIHNLQSSYKELIKIVKKNGDRKTKAQIYFKYAEFLYNVQKNYSKAYDFYQKVSTLYQALKMPQMVSYINKFIDEQFDENRKPKIQKDNKESKK